MNYWEWNCPLLGSREFQLLLKCGWSMNRMFTVDNRPWAHLIKPRDCVDNTAKVLS